MTDDGLTPGEFAARFAAMDAMIDAVKQMSEMLTGMVHTLMGEGWTESQARDLVVATMLMHAHNPQPS